MEFKNETQTEKFTIMFLSFDRSISSFFFVCVLCVFWMDFLSIFGTGIYREEGKLCSTRKCRHAMGCHYLFHKSV